MGNFIQNPFEIDFDSYIMQGEPEQKENGKLWKTAIGLQQVDGLTPSEYLYRTAKRNIDGEISIEDAKHLIDSYYETRQNRAEDEKGTEEADKVSVRIREILAEKTFSFTPDLLLSIHKRLFSGIFYTVKAGQFRDYNISKREWVLDGESVLYASSDMIRQTLDYDFNQEKVFDYSKLSKEESVKHLTRFIANIWQIHPFGEGNTRTTAVFTIKYLRSLGFELNNEPFEKNSWYFRNALVRANYTDMKKSIYMNTEYLEKFFRNLLLGESNELKNRYCHIKYVEAVKSEKRENKDRMSAGNEQETVEKNRGENVKTVEKILSAVEENPKITQKQLSEITGLTRRGIEWQLKQMKEKGIINRVGPDKGGHWEIIKNKEPN